MKSKLTMMVAIATAFAAVQLTAMPTEEETRRAEPVVQKLLASEREAFASGRKTRSEVAAAAMKLADEADSDAAKLLLMKGAFVLYVQDGKLEKAVETMKALEAAIADMPPQSVTNMIKTALLGVSRKVDGAQLYKLLDEKRGADRPNVEYKFFYKLENGKAIITGVDPKSVGTVGPVGSLVIPDKIDGHSVTHIGWESFRYCKELTSVTIPEGVTHIDGHAFDQCYGLKSVTLPSSLKDIGWAAFGGCAGLTSVTIPNGVKSIAADAFNGCRSLKNVVIPNSVTRIGDRAFCGCRELESATIPAGVASIGSGVFGGCNALKLIQLDSGNSVFTLIDGALYTKDRSELVMWPNPPKSVTIPDGVTNIRGWAFTGGSGMTSVTIPESVTRIGGITFIGCAGLKSITIPSRVKNMGEHVFERCVELTEVTMLGERPEAPKDLFPGCGKLKSIHVPMNAKSWAGMKEWHGIPLVFDAEVRAATEKAPNNGNATSPTPSTNGLWTVAQYNSASPIPSLVEAKELVEKASKVAEKTYQTLSFENNYRGRGCFPHVEFPGTTAGENADYFAIVATGNIYVPNEGDWTFACLNDDGVRFTISGNGLSDTFENDGLGGIFRAPWLRTVHFPRAGIYSVTCLFFENLGIAGLEFSVARGNHSRFDSSKFKLVGDPESGIVMVGDAKDAGRQVKAEHAFRRPGLLNSRPGGRLANEPREREQAGAAQGGALARLRERRMRIMQEQQAEAARRAAAANEEKAENECREAEARAAAAEAAAEREQQRIVLHQIQEELRRQREEKDRRAVRAEETAQRQTFSRMFPGWQTSVEPAIESRHRGQDNVAFVHPPSQQTPAVVSRTLTLSNGNPCLFLKMASFDKGSDFYLSVLVDGKEVLPQRRICTPDNEPWQDITIPLFAWRGSKVKIEIVLTANNWWCEHPFFKRLEVAEGTGREKLDLNAIGSETGRQAFARLFPGWQPSAEPGTESKHRGQDDVVYVHPPSQKTPAVVSRALTLSNGNPCLFLKMASFDGGSDFLLSVLVNGKEVLPKRLICTPDYAPWQDITIPLFAWRGQDVKIEVVLTANNWWREHPFFKRLEVAEGNGQEQFVPEAKETVNGYTWSYRVNNDGAAIVAENAGKFSCAVSPTPTGDVSIPATLNGVKVTSIGREAFRGCTGLESVTIPEGVTSIEREAFNGCSGLTSVTIPGSVTGIGTAAFDNCSGLKSVDLKQGVETLDWHVFRRCNGLTSVTIPSSMTNINGSAFIDIGALTSFQVESDNRFYKSEDGLLLTKDGTTLVHGVNGDVTIPSSVTAIGPNAFEGCAALKSVSIPSGVKNIDAWAFKNCRGVSAVALPPSVTNIGYQAFWGCGLTSVTIPEGIANIAECAFISCANLASVTLPSSLKRIERGAFAFCRGLKAVTIPEGVAKIDANAFMWCSGLKSVEIPSGVKDIGNNAFEQCVNLESVTFCGEAPNAFKDVFKGCGKLKSIHVPANAKSWAGMKEWQGIPLVFDAK